MSTATLPSPLPPDLPVFLEVPFAAKLLGISRSAAYRHVDAGELPSKRLGGRV